MTRLNSEGKNQSKDPPNLDLVCTAYFSGVLCSLFSHIEISIFKTLFERKQSAKIFLAHLKEPRIYSQIVLALTQRCCILENIRKKNRSQGYCV